MEGEDSISRILERFNSGDASAWEQLAPAVYSDLRRLARQRLASERDGHTLGVTALVHECYLRLLQTQQLAASSRGDFLAIASSAMRRIMVDYARSRNRHKRHGGRAHVPIEDVEAWLSDREAGEVLLLEEALRKLQELDQRAAQVIEMRFFGGLSLEETAGALGVSAKTVQRTWIAARAWLRKEIGTLPDVQDES